MRDTLQNLNTLDVKVDSEINHNFRSNVLETLRWFCSELRADEIEQSLRELFSTAACCRLLECNVVIGDDSGLQERALADINVGQGDSATVIPSDSDCTDSLYSLVQLELGGLSLDGLPWDARINLAAKSGSENVWKTILRDISCTSSPGENALLSDMEQPTEDSIEIPGFRIGPEVVARELARELQSPLGAILASVKHIETDSEENRVCSDDGLLKTIESSANKIDSILADFVRMSRYPALTTEPSDLMDLVSEVAENCSIGTEDDIPIELSRSTRPAVVEVDTKLIKRAIQHVLSVLPESLSDCTGVSVQCLKKGDSVGLEFRFEGKRTGPDILRKVVLPFDTAKDGGAGLETMPLHMIIGAHGGITVIDPSDDQTVLTIILPSNSTKRSSQSNR